MPDEVADIQALAGLGWVDGRNVWMDLRWAGANTNRMRALAQERPLSSFRGAIPSPAASSRGSTSRAGTQRHRSNDPQPRRGYRPARAAQDAVGKTGGGGDANRIRAFAQEAEAELPARLHTAIAGLREAGRRRKEVAA